jgi:16S rRNA (uracil1498-N3)-methyltransferase
MQIFYAPDITGDSYILNENESKHLIRVLRMTKGSKVRLIDGMGNMYEGIIIDPDKKKCCIKIISKNSDFEKRDYKLHIAISPVKNNERFEWFIEKVVEIGVDEITPLICKNTEKFGIKTDRINNIIISAMKQSLKAYKPMLNEPISFKEFIDSEYSGKKIIAHCNDTIDRYKVTDVYHKGENICMAIGPEGDFCYDEIEYAIKNGYSSVHLGKSRLRTETAGISACHSIYFINQ